MTTLILINGPAGSGKTWLKKAIYQKLPMHVPCVYHGFKDPLRAMLFAFVQSFSSEIRYYPDDDIAYANFKKTTYFGKTGREWMIVWGTAMRVGNENILSDMLAAKVKATRSGVVIADDLGFRHEAVYPWEDCASHVIKVYMTGENVGMLDQYVHGQQFKDDSRFCLRGLCSVTDPTPDGMLEHLNHLFQANVL